MSKKHRTVLITGCSSGIGHQLVSHFLSNQWRVIATLRNAEERKDLFAEEIKAYGNRLSIQSLDVTDPNQRATVASSIPGGGLDCLVNNAGYSQMGALETCDEDQIRAQMEVNLIAPMLFTRTLLPAIRKAQGSIINVSSMMGFVGLPLSSSYCASKGGLSMFTESLYHELRPLGVRVSLIEPGGFRTNFSENTKWGNTPMDVYEKATADGQSLQSQLSSGEGKSPHLVVERIIKIANGDLDSARSRIGIDAVGAAIFSAICPSPLRIKATGWCIEKYIEKKLTDG